MKTQDILQHAANAIADSRGYARQFSIHDPTDLQRGDILGSVTGELMKLYAAVGDWFETKPAAEPDAQLVAAYERARDALEDM